MSIQRVFVIFLLVLTGITVTLLIKFNSDFAPSTKMPAKNHPSAVVPSPDTRLSQGAAVPTPVQKKPTIQNTPDFMQYESGSEEEETESEREEINMALAEMGSAEVERRVEAAEQLGAYPTTEAELALIQALTSDSSAEVRSAAAQSLGYVENPSDAALEGLFSALDDQIGDVRESALSALEDFLLGSDEGSERYKRVREGLRLKMESRSVAANTRRSIREILEDLDVPE